MNTEVKLIIIPSDVDVSDVLDVPVYGKNLSTAESIVVNKAKFGYTVIYDEETFNSIRMPNLAASLIKVFKTNLPNQGIMFSIMHELDDDGTHVQISATTNHLFVLHGLFKDIVSRTNQDGSKACPDVYYYSTGQMKDIVDLYTHAYGNTVAYTKAAIPEDEDDDDMWNEFGDPDDEEDEDEETEDPFESFHGLKRRKENTKKEFYGRSRVFKESKDPRKEIRRHGVIVAQSKNDIKKDEKIIKEFLKDFIPGKGDWKKEFRNELAKRWMSVYTISKKNLKIMEKEYRHSIVKKRKDKEAKHIIRFADKMFNIPVDRWNDPSK